MNRLPQHLLWMLFFLFIVSTSCNTDLDISSSVAGDKYNSDLQTKNASARVASKPNILLILVDDLGLDASPCYAEGTEKPYMPNLSSLCANGLVFDNVWANPSCSPSRAAILTGRYGFRTGVRDILDVIPLSEKSIYDFMKDNASEEYNQALIGKWHLAGPSNGNRRSPNLMGVPYYSGLLKGSVPEYDRWWRVENGKPSTSEVYATTKITNDAIEWLDDQKEEKPWFLWLSYNAPHTPFHFPDPSLHNQGQLPEDPISIKNNPRPYFMAMLEAMDTEMGRLLNSLSAETRRNTTIIFLSDNGTDAKVVQAPYKRTRAKRTLFQGGIHVPMIVSGHGVQRVGQRERAMVNVTDVFATIADIAGSGVSKIHDSQSFKGLLSSSGASRRKYNYTEIYSIGTGIGNERNSGWTIRNDKYKLIAYENCRRQFYDLRNDPYERRNLLRSNLKPVQASALNELINEANRLRGLPMCNTGT